VQRWHRYRTSAGLNGEQASHFLLAGIAGTWLFMTVALGAAGWMVWNRQGFAIGGSGIGVGASQDEGRIL